MSTNISNFYKKIKKVCRPSPHEPAAKCHLRNRIELTFKMQITGRLVLLATLIFSAVIVSTMIVLNMAGKNPSKVSYSSCII